MGGKSLDQFQAKEKSKAQKEAKTGTTQMRDTEKSSNKKT